MANNKTLQIKRAHLRKKLLARKAGEAVNLLKGVLEEFECDQTPSCVESNAEEWCIICLITEFLERK
jgi:hypothetical protein